MGAFLLGSSRSLSVGRQFRRPTPRGWGRCFATYLAIRRVSGLLASGVVLALDELNAVFIRVSIRNVYFRLHGEGAGAQGLGIRPARQELR